MEPQSRPSTEVQPKPPAPVMDVVVAPPPENPTAANADSHPTDTKAAKPTADNAAAQKPSSPKQPGNGVGMAIFATVVIVIVLAALATYAYLKQK